MNLLRLPWLDLAILFSLIGSIWVSQFRDPQRANRWGLFFSGLTFGCTFLAWLAFYLRVPVDARLSLQPWIFKRMPFSVDELSAPMVPTVALLHLLTAVATTRTKMRRFSFSWSLASEAIRIATFSCRDGWALVGLLIAGTIPPYMELINRGKGVRVYVIHMTLFVALLLFGWWQVHLEGYPRTVTGWAAIPLLLAILIRCGTVPAHCWITEWFEHASFGNAILFVMPLTGVYAAVRLVLPYAPDWVLQGLSVMSLLTAVYAAGMATIQRDARRFFAFLFLSHASLVLVGTELVTSLSLTGALSLWFSVILSLGGFGLTLRALEARYGRLALTDFHGLYENSPMLAICFLLTGLASVGFPGTLGFVSSEMLVDGVIHANLWVGLGVVFAAALNGIAVVRAYFLLFTGARHPSMVHLRILWNERLAVLVLVALIIGGGLFPQPGVASRYKAAEKILWERKPQADPSE